MSDKTSDIKSNGLGGVEFGGRQVGCYNARHYVGQHEQSLMPSVTRKRESVRVRNRASVQRRLLMAVEGLLASGETYTELSVERIIREADISRSTFYLHYADKGALLAALSEETAKDATLPMSKWLELPSGATKDELRDALGDLADTYRQHGTLLAAVVEAAGYDETVRHHWDNIMDNGMGRIRRGLEHGLKDGRIRPDVDPRWTAQWLMWTIAAGFYQVFRTPVDTSTRNEYLQELTELIWWRLFAR